eukprot:EG_transcript_10240
MEEETDECCSPDPDAVRLGVPEFSVETPGPHVDLGAVSRWVYVSHALTRWNERMWSFAIGLFLVEVFGGSLLLTALYGFSSGGVVLVFGALLGSWLDRTERLKAARWTLYANKGAINCCAVVLVVLLQFDEWLAHAWGGWLRVVGYGLVILFADIAALASTGNTIAIEQDWVAQLCGGDGERLTKLTSTLRAIDLSTNILAPIVCGQVMSLASMTAGAAVICSCSLLSLLVEYRLLLKVYETVPALATKRAAAAPAPEGKGSLAALRTMWDSWGLYYAQPVFLPGLALASLYLTVLGFDNVTCGYAYSQGMAEGQVGVALGLGAGAGILATVLFPWLAKKCGILKSGMVGLSYQLSFLCLSLASVWAPGSPLDLHAWTNPLPEDTTSSRDPSSHSMVSLLLLISGIVFSRTGLWLADLSITQQFLESVPDGQRGRVNGVQSSINRLLDMLKYGLVIALPRPQTFGLLVVVSFISVCSGWGIYLVHMCRNRRPADAEQLVE